MVTKVHRKISPRKGFLGFAFLNKGLLFMREDLHLTTKYAILRPLNLCISSFSFSWALL